MYIEFIITDGTAVLGLGVIRPEMEMPVTEGKCVHFKTFVNVGAIPLCIRSEDVEEIVNMIILSVGCFRGLKLKDFVSTLLLKLKEN